MSVATILLTTATALVFSILLAGFLPSTPFRISHDGVQAEDTLLTQFPFIATREVSLGDKTWKVKSPYHAFDSIGNIVMGTANNYEKVQQLITAASNPDLPPLKVTKTSDGKALASAWLMDYSNTGVGPYKEVVLATWVGIESTSCASTDPYCFLQLWNKQSQGAQLFLLKLWLDSEVAIAYGRDLFGTDKHKVKGAFVTKHSDDGGRSSLDLFHATGVLKASIKSPPTMGAFVLATIKHTGFSGLIKNFITPYFDTSCVCPNKIAKTVPENANPLMISRLAMNLEATAHEWSPEQGDSFEIDGEDGAIFTEIGFVPQLTSRDTKMRFAMMTPSA